MKRKLDANDVPTGVSGLETAAADDKTTNKEATVAAASDPSKESKDQKVASFNDLGLDPRLVQAVAEQGYQKPTLVQRKAIPLALSGQDVLCKAKTGSGKTAAYMLPVISAILKRKNVCAPPFDSTMALPRHLLFLWLFKHVF
jgi:ATP-dependent RNA helicase DDX56/DBP9